MHPTCYSYWLANSFCQFCPQDACASVDVLNLFDNLNCIALLDWLVWLHLPHCLQWVLVIAILSTSLSACVDIMLLSCFVSLNCIDLYYWLELYCVFAYAPQSTVSTGLYLFSSPTCLLVLFLLQEERFICFDIVYYYLHVVTDIDIYCWYFVCFQNCWGQSPLPSPL